MTKTLLFRVPVRNANGEEGGPVRWPVAIRLSAGGEREKKRDEDDDDDDEDESFRITW